MKIPPIHPVCKRKVANVSKSSFIYQLLLINSSSKALDSDQIRSFEFPNTRSRYKVTYQWLRNHWNGKQHQNGQKTNN